MWLMMWMKWGVETRTSDTLNYKEKKVLSKRGSCISRNVIYFAACLLCMKGYVGKTVSHLRTRINGHRALYYKFLRNPEKTISDNLYNNDLSLGYHLCKEHNCKDRRDFNNYYRFTILQHCNPDDLDVIENREIHRLKTLEPGGINAANPLSIPLIQWYQGHRHEFFFDLSILGWILFWILKFISDPIGPLSITDLYWQFYILIFLMNKTFWYFLDNRWYLLTKIYSIIVYWWWLKHV